MRINCELEIVYSLAVAKGGISSRSSRSRAALSLGKKPVPMRSTDVSGEGSKREELYLIVSTAKNVAGTKYKVSSGKLLSLYCKAAPIYLSHWGGHSHRLCSHNYDHCQSHFGQQSKHAQKYSKRLGHSAEWMGVFARTSSYNQQSELCSSRRSMVENQYGQLSNL